MSLFESVKKGFDKAREEATELAQTAKLRMDVNKLNDRKAALFHEIGEQVYARTAAGKSARGYEAQCEEIRSIDAQVAAKQAEIDRLRAEQPIVTEPAV